MEQSIYNSIRLQDGAVNAAGMHQEGGIGIRVVKGQNTGYAYTESALPADREKQL